jgi:hypothetical protein
MTGRTDEDFYDSYDGPSLLYAWGDIEGVDIELQVELARRTSSDEAAALERTIRAWSDHGVREGYGNGWLHGLYHDTTFGLRWTGSTLRWLEDFGSANPTLAANDLARRLAGWSAHWDMPIVRLQFGR